MSTAQGYADKPGLPQQELVDLKAALKGSYPQYSITGMRHTHWKHSG